MVARISSRNRDFNDVSDVARDVRSNLLNREYVRECGTSAYSLSSEDKDGGYRRVTF